MQWLRGIFVNFDLSEDEEMLKALAERFVADRYDLERRRTYQATATGFCLENWRLLAELGLIGAPFAVDDGGAGLDATAIAVVFEALGRGLVVEPLGENILLAGRLFAATAGEALRDTWLGDVVAGRKRMALAHFEEGARDDRLWVETSVADEEGSVTLSGAKMAVAGAGGADAFIVTARRGGEASDPDGVVLCLVEAAAPGLTIREWRSADGVVMASLALDHVSAQPLDGGLPALQAIAPMASLARTAEAVGIMRRMMDETLGYLRTRQQFGAPLGSFQAIQHRMAAQYAALEQAGALVDLAVMSPGDEFAAAVDGARAFIADAAVTLGHEMIQFHGGMGVSDELSIGHAHKRLFFLSRWPESPDATLDRMAGV